MNGVEAQLDRMCLEAWSAVATDVRRARSQAGKTGIAFVRDHPVLTVVGGGAIGFLLLRGLLPAKQRPEAAQRKRVRRAKRRKHAAAGGIRSALGGLLQTWALEMVMSMLKPAPSVEPEHPDVVTRN